MSKGAPGSRKGRYVAIVAGAAAGAVLALTAGASLALSPLTGILGNVVGSATAAAPQARMDTTPAAGEKPQANQAQVVDGQTWSVTSFRNTQGQLCAGEKVPSNGGGDGGQELVCDDPDAILSGPPLTFVVGSRQIPPNITQWDNAWVWGWAAPAVASVELQLTDCSTVPLAINANRIFSYVLGAQTLGGGVGPEQLIAYGSDGTILENQPIALDRPWTPQAQAAGASAPAPSNCG